MYSPFKFNKDVKYHFGPYYHEKSVEVTKLTISVTEVLHFEANPPNIFDKYLNPDINQMVSY